MTPLATVLGYAAKGWQVFPLQVRAKEPLERSRGFYDATSNPKRLERWFARYPYNVGIRTGTASGICVLDVDGDVGFESLRHLEHGHGRLPPTLT
jgi:Bifunctional DNA primase/polymerase, N-terminal